VPCAYMHAVVSPAFSHARLTLDWLAISRALLNLHRSCAGVSLSRAICMFLEVGHAGTLSLPQETSSSNRRDHERNSLDADVWPAINTDEASIPESSCLVFASVF